MDTTLWMVVAPDGTPLSETVRDNRNDSIFIISVRLAPLSKFGKDGRGLGWKKLYREGYRVRKIPIRWFHGWPAELLDPGVPD